MEGAIGLTLSSAAKIRSHLFF